MGKKAYGNQCPITGGLPTKCTERGFREACQKFQDNLAAQTGTRSELCATCKGRTPPGEIIFIELDYVRPGVITAMNEKTVKKDKKVPCALCGEEKSIKPQYGKNVCSYCHIVRLQAKNRPDVLIKALQEFAQLPENFETDGPADLQAEVERLRTELSVAKNALLTGAGQDTVPSLKAELLAANRKLEAANVRLLQLERMGGKTLDVVRLQELAWKFAEGVMTGEVVGVDVEDIRLLRGVQYAYERAFTILSVAEFPCYLRQLTE